MTTRNKYSNYQQLSARFGAVRRAWKRAAALSGFAVVVTEGIGVFTAILFLDWLYQPQPVVRLVMWAVGLVGIGYFFVQHVIKPLLRKIPDEQIALYIEENRSGMEGVLITAAEFGRKRDGLTGKEGSLIDAVLKEAESRSAHMHVGRVADFSRLRKYGFIALAGIGAYVLVALLFPDTLGHHIGRVLQPWYATEEDVAGHASAVAQAEPMRFTLSKGDTSLARGGSFDFEVTLSKPKPADQAVTLNFRPKAGGDWQKLAMTEIEKLNGFQGTLPDVSEDLDFYIACGSVKSDTFQLTVYDPLVVRSLEMATHYPDYVKQPDRIEKPSTGDVTALVGSKVTLRIVTSTPLKDGEIKWSKGETDSVSIDPKDSAAAIVTFEVKEDDTFDYTLTDVNGQQAVSNAPLSVHAIPDTPPTLKVKTPAAQVLTNPLGEINFDIEAGDDFGVLSLDLVYSRIDAKGNSQDTRIPLTAKAVAATDMQHAVIASYRLALEDANPPVQPNDAIPFHVEARDAKGQVTSSPIGMVIVGYFEHWGTWAKPDGGKGGGGGGSNADLMKILALVWELDNQKAQIKTDELQKRSLAIAGQLEGPDGTITDFVNLKMHPELGKVIDLINGHIKKAHDALMTSDTVTGSTQLSIAAAILVGNGIKLDADVTGSEKSQGTVGGSHTTPPGITMLEQARLSALAVANKSQAHSETDPTANSDAAKAVADLLKQQSELAANAKALTSPTSDKADTGHSKGGTGDQPNKPKTPSAADLAAQQHAIAEQARAAAAKSQGAAAASNNTKLSQVADKTAAAARLMEEASRAFAAGKNTEAQAKADQAKATLQEASNALQTNDREKLASAIGDAESRVAVLAEKQKDLSAKTDALAKALGANKPDQRQQRDLQAQAYQQTLLSAEAESLKGEVGRLNDQAGQIGQPEASQALSDAQRLFRRGQPQTKLSNAVVDLHNGDLGAAAGEQKNALDSLQKLADNLQAGSDALAASRQAQLNRAARVAKEAQKSLDALQGKAPNEKGTSAAQQPSGTSDGNGGDSRLDEARKLAYNITQLASVVDNRQLIPQDQVEQLKEMSMDKSELEKRLATDPKLLQNIATAVGNISDKIEAELEAKTEAGKLYSSQREECPPAYRQFVNKYFEALSHVARPPDQADQPVTPSATAQP